MSSADSRLHPFGPDVLAGMVVFPLAQAKRVLTRYREFVELAPLELNVWIVLRKAPALPFLPTNIHGEEVVIACRTSSAEAHRTMAAGRRSIIAFQTRLASSYPGSSGTSTVPFISPFGLPAFRGIVMGIPPLVSDDSGAREVNRMGTYWS
jgi:hypothetical protein